MDEDELRQALLRRKLETAAKRKAEKDAAAADAAADAAAAVGGGVAVGAVAKVFASSADLGLQAPRRIQGKQAPPSWYNGRFLQSVIAHRRPAADVATAAVASATPVRALVQPVFAPGDEKVSRNTFTCRWYDRAVRVAKKSGMTTDEMKAQRKHAFALAGVVYDKAMSK